VKKEKLLGAIEKPRKRNNSLSKRATTN